MLTVKSDDVAGRSKAYEAIVKGENIPRPGVPESFKVLVRELQSLGLDITVLRRTEEGRDQEVDLTIDESELRKTGPQITLSRKDIGLEDEMQRLRGKEVEVGLASALVETKVLAEEQEEVMGEEKKEEVLTIKEDFSDDFEGEEK